MKWAIEIQRTCLQRRNLGDLLQGIGFDLIDEMDSLLIASPLINTCPTAANVYEIAKKVRAVFRGPAKIDPEFEFGAVVDFSAAPARRHTFIEAQGFLIISGSAKATLTVSPPIGLSTEKLAKWHEEYDECKYQLQLERQRALLEPAFFNPNAAKVIELLSVESPTGEILYKIYELLEGNPKDRGAFQAIFGVEKEEFSRFKDAVHNPKVSGDWARHAYVQELNSSRPMTRAEATQFVRNLSTKWLACIRANHLAASWQKSHLD